MTFVDRQPLAALAKEVQNNVEAHLSGDQTARSKLLASTEALHRIVEGPSDYVPDETFCILMAQEMGVLDVIVSKGAASVSAASLSKEVKYDEVLIMRVMRMITACGICDETGPQSYRANEVTRLICAPGAKGGVRITDELGFRTASKLTPYMRTIGVHQFPGTPGQPTPFEYAFGMSMWDLFRKDPEKKKFFDDFMTNRKSSLKAPWFEIFPAASELFREAPEHAEVTLVDVGGGQGSHIRAFRKRYPDLPGRFILQDLPETIEPLQKNPPDGVENMPYNFFQEEPVKGARAYILTNVLHDWSDDACRAILGNLAKAMHPKSRILIEELVLADTGVSFFSAAADINMLMLPGGMERTENQWKQVCSSTEPPLELVKVWNKQKDMESVLEIRRAA